MLGNPYAERRVIAVLRLDDQVADCNSKRFFALTARRRSGECGMITVEHVRTMAR
jgi:hypothetical protein